MERFYSHGKLLLTGEYLVLDGARALAVPTKLGQYLSIEPLKSPQIIWTSLDANSKPWFRAEFNWDDKHRITLESQSDQISDQLLNLLNQAKGLNPNFLPEGQGYRITTHLEFPKDWGLGSSSTLISNLAMWADIDPYILLEMSFGGSGYDLACAQAQSPITYQITSNGTPMVEPVVFDPEFKDDLYFIYLNKKQNSRTGIQLYQKHKTNIKDSIKEIDQITDMMLNCNSLSEFCLLIERHEDIISRLIQSNPIKTERFKDFNGSIKSLGAWGGDFILAASSNNPTTYFKEKGYPTVIPFKEMVL